MAAAPYKTTPVFDEESLPDAIRNAHNTKDGVWGLLRVLEGEVRLVFHEPHKDIHVAPENPAVIPPQAVHHVELTGTMRMQVEFYREAPLPSPD
jgi:tellurite resistance-related uncharacterized protein